MSWCVFPDGRTGSISDCSTFYSFRTAASVKMFQRDHRTNLCYYRKDTSFVLFISSKCDSKGCVMEQFHDYNKKVAITCRDNGILKGLPDLGREGKYTAAKEEMRNRNRP